MNPELLGNILLTVATASTPLLIAALGELVVERTGVLNLGVEGMMILGAAAGFAGASLSGSPWLGVLCGIGAGALAALVFGLLTLGLATNQVATGLSLTLLGLGLSGLVGESFVGVAGVKLAALDLGALVGLPLSDIPVLGRFLFNQDPIFYIGLLLCAAVSVFLFRTRAGLTLRAVGDNHDSAHALGIGVIGIRYAALAFGGGCAGLAGAQLSLVYTTQWVENMTAGRGWIALALVVFASWRPARVLVGAYLFGGVTIGQLHAQAFGVQLPPQLLSALPYAATVMVLVLISRNRRLTLLNTPACLGRPFVASR